MLKLHFRCNPCGNEAHTCTTTGITDGDVCVWGEGVQLFCRSFAIAILGTVSAGPANPSRELPIRLRGKRRKWRERESMQTGPCMFLS